MFCNNSDIKFSTFSKLYIFFCKKRKVLNVKIVNFFFNIIYLSLKNFEYSSFNVRKGSNFFFIYKILFLFLKFTYFILEFINNNFRMNSDKFFANKRDLVEYLIYYKFFLYMIFLNKKNQFLSVLGQFSFNLYFNYLLYSIFFFIRLFIKKIQNLELKKKRSNSAIVEFSISKNLKKCHLFYKKKIYLTNPRCNNKKLKVQKENIPLYLFCSNRVNFKTLDDLQFSILLNQIRTVYRKRYFNQNSFKVLNLIIKKSIPLSKIVYQRRGRNFIPLMTFVYSQDIRNSLGLKSILSNKNKITGLVKDSFENHLLINLLDILILYTEDDFVYQGDKDSSVRKEAYSKGYYLKTLKSNFRALK